MAFTAHDGMKQVCCLVPLRTLACHFGTEVRNAQALGQAFDRHRGLIEETASDLYDRTGSDECGELLLTDADLRRRAQLKLAGTVARARLDALIGRGLPADASAPVEPAASRPRTIRW